MDDVPILRLSDGRHASYRLYGADGGFPVIGLHGTPGSHLKFRAAHLTAKKLGMTIIALDRWCYGRTEAPAAPSLSAYAADVAEIADRLGVGRIAVLGISGGSPYAAAVAATLGGRVRASALVAPVGPLSGPGPRPPLGPMHFISLRVLSRLPWLVSGGFCVLGLIARQRPRLATQIASAFAPEADRRLAAERNFADDLGQTFAAGLKFGSRGPVIDLALFRQRWNVDLARTSAPSRIWIGTCDRNVPLTAVDSLARRLQRAPGGVYSTPIEGAGHYWIADNFGEVLQWIGQAVGSNGTS